MSAPLFVRDSLGRPVALGKEMSKGEQSALYAVTRREGSVAKIWLDPLDPKLAAKLQAAVQVRSTALEDAAAWPITTLQNAAGQAIGYLMAQVNTSEFRPLSQLYAPSESRGDFARDWGFRIQVARRLAQAFAVLHAAGQVMGDVSERHILVSPGAQVRLIGVDDYQINHGEQIYSAQRSLLELTPPELQSGGIAAQSRTPNHDLFGLAVMIFRLLFGGRHPYSGVPVGRAMPGPGEAIAADAFAYARFPQPTVKAPPGVPGLDVLPPEVAKLFERAFSPQRAQRPEAQVWQGALTAVFQALVKCEVDAEHLKVQGRPCPLCAVDSRVSPIAAPPSRSAGSVAVGSVAAGSVAAGLQRLWQQVQSVSPPNKPLPDSEIPDGPRLPPLALNLPTKPRSVLSPDVQEMALRWVLRLSFLAALTALVIFIQKSVWAALLEVGLVLFALTIGRRFSVDWDGLIDNFQNAEGRFVERLTPAQGQWQGYHLQLEKRRDEIKKRFLSLRDEFRALEERYVNENAYSAYQRELLNLDGQRRKLQRGSEAQTSAVQALIDQQASLALNEFLKRQVIAPHVVPELSSRLALHLTTMGVRRASDIQTDKLKVVRPDLADALVAWRNSLVQFFHFNPDSIPGAELEAAQRQEMEQTNADFRQFDRAVKAFAATDWHTYDHGLIKEMQSVKAQARQYQKALKVLDELVK